MHAKLAILSAMPDIYAVVINWNAADDTIECVESLLQQTLLPTRIVIVDNGSRCKSIETIKAAFDSNEIVEIIQNSSNLGFTGGANTGIDYALTEGADFVALLNNDATADVAWLKQLTRPLINDASIGISTSLLMRKPEVDLIDTAGLAYSTWGLPFPIRRDEPYEEAGEGRFVFGASGGASIYRADMLKELGNFDNDYFAYYEDVDLSFRAHMYGWRVYFEPTAVVHHAVGATSSKMGGFTSRQVFRNLPLLYLRNIPNELLIPIGARLMLAYSLMLGKAIASGQALEALKGLLQAIGLTSKSVRLRKERRVKLSTNYIDGLLYPDLPPQQKGLRRLLLRK